MKSKIVIGLLATLSFSASALAVKVGATAPSFEAQGADGATHKLEDYKKQYVVLEWHNKDCPFVKKMYGTHKMQELQAKWTGKNVAWLEVISSAPGKEGYADAKAALADKTATDAHPTAILLDAKGDLAHKYDAKTTPQMIIIAPGGKIVYDGAIDDKPTPDKEDVKVAKNYVDTALTELIVEKKAKVTTDSTPPYGCSVKY